MEMKRRTLAKGAAWAAPVVLSSAALPAYAASRECGTQNFVAPSPTNENGSTTNWTVPAGVNVICFTVLGAAGGGYTAQAPGGAGAQLTGKLPVSPGDTLTLVVGSGGLMSIGRDGVPGLETSATGGKGYGDGGDSIPTPLASIEGTLVRSGASGGAGSAILLNGQPVVIAGGGGGASARSRNTHAPNGYNWNGTQINQGNLASANPLSVKDTEQQLAGSGGGSRTNATRYYKVVTANNAAILGETITLGGQANGGADGRGGDAANKLTTYEGRSMELEYYFTAGESGSSAAAPGPAKGGNGRSQYGERYYAGDPLYPNMLAGTLRAQSTGAGGGGGYGGGAAGASHVLTAAFNQQVAPQNAQGEPDPSGRTIDGRRIFGQITALALAGGAGGSYLAPQVSEGQVQEGQNHNSTAGVRNHGAISFTY